MSLRAITWAFEQHQTSPTQRLVLLALADHANNENECWLSTEKLEVKTGFSRSTIYRALSDMKRSGLLNEGKDGNRERLTLRLPADHQSQSETGLSQSETGLSQSETGSIYVTQTEPIMNRKGRKEEVERIWLHYLSKPGKQSNRTLPKEEARLINNALDVRSVDEIIKAIDGNFDSDYHQKRGLFADRPGQKYNKLSQIIKGRQGKETTGERIDYFIEISENADSGILPADPAVISRRKQDVQRGHRQKDNSVAVRKAKEAEAWLSKHGIETVRADDGFPTFRKITDRDI